MIPSLDERLRKLPSELQPLAGAVWQQHTRGVSRRADGTIQVAPTPWVGPEAYAIMLYPPPEPAWVAAFAHRSGQSIPESYARVLAALNGCFAFGLALYGLPPSLYEPPSRLDRRALEPLDLDAANRYWAHEYRGAEREFHFGGCTWTATENVGYFLTPGGPVRSRRKEGEVLREWPSIRDLLAEELPSAEARERRTGTTWPWEKRRPDA